MQEMLGDRLEKVCPKCGGTMSWKPKVTKFDDLKDFMRQVETADRLLQSAYFGWEPGHLSRKATTNN
jgi:hypothetical protein